MGAFIHPLTAEQIVRLWEVGARQHPLDRALLCLEAACPDLSLAELARCSIGQRDALLLTVRELTFGPRMDSQATCPHCGEQLEFSLTVADIRVRDLEDGEVKSELPPHQLQRAGLDLTFRLPNSLDLAAIATLPNSEARFQLAQRCVLHAEREGHLVSLEKEEGAIAHLSQHLAEADPQAEVLLDLQCPACQKEWQLLFDIGAFLWQEICVQAQRLLQEVHLLARAYGWREADILALSSTRRHYYLELVS